ncbi:MAG: helix-turn-helix domain-containing protein [Mycobacteriales bacterium]
MWEVIGLDAEAARVYEGLLTGRPAAVKELVAATGLVTSRVRAALRLLEARGLVARTSGPPPGYVALDPGIALDVLLGNHEEQLRKARIRAQEVSEQFRQAVAGRDPAELVEVVKGRGTIVRRVDQIQRAAQRDLRFFDKPPYHGGHGLANRAELDFLERGGRARSVYETAAVAIPDRRPMLELYQSAGEQARVLPALPTKLIIVDDRLALVPLHLDTTDTPSPSFVIVHRSALLEALCHLFETLWQVALPFRLPGAPGEDAPAVGAEPDALERRILSLMNAGLPDEAIARHVGLSHRTLQRRVHDLMDRLHAVTRYQLGAQAAARGWLS